MKTNPPVDLNLVSESMGPVTDLYQLTMMAGYEGAGLGGQLATFELFVRRLPPRRSYLVFAGLEQAIAAVLNLRFSQDQVNDLRTWPTFAAIPSSWFDRLIDFRFQGNIWAVPEGTVVFAGEPLLRVEAALPQAQLVETLLLGSLGYPTLVASKAARIVAAAQGKQVFDFGARRGHGLQASFLAARSAYIAGFDGTSQVEAARRLGIPAVGTMAHSWVQAFEDEPRAFAAFARQFPGSTVLVDTYDTMEGVRFAAAVEPAIRAIRIDSGDLLNDSKQARLILNEHRREQVQIVLSGDLDEDSIARLIAAGSPVDQFGVGTELITSGGAPALSMVYKLVETGGAGRIKKSLGKRTYPLAKQIDRRHGQDGRLNHDLVVQANETVRGEALLELLVLQGQLTQPWPSLQAIRQRCDSQIQSLPESIRALDTTDEIPVRYSDLLQSAAIRLGLEHPVKPPTERL